MNYTVVWGPRVEQMLAAVWLASVDRNAVTRASEEIDLLLRGDPLRVGRHLNSSIRRTFSHSPIGVIFEVVEDDKKVVVQAVYSTI